MAVCVILVIVLMMLLMTTLMLLWEMRYISTQSGMESSSQDWAYLFLVTWMDNQSRAAWGHDLARSHTLEVTSFDWPILSDTVVLLVIKKRRLFNALF